MKITRRQLRQIINESLNEGRFQSDVGQKSKVVGGGIGGIAAAIPGSISGPLVPLAAMAGAAFGAWVAGKGADLMGYKTGQIPEDHPLFLKNLERQSFDNAEDLDDYMKGIERGKFTAIYTVSDFEEITNPGLLKMMAETGRVAEGLQAAMNAVVSMKEKGITKGFGLLDKGTYSDLGSGVEEVQPGLLDKVGSGLASLNPFSSNDEEEETALASLEDPFDDDLQKKT